MFFKRWFQRPSKRGSGQTPAGDSRAATAEPDAAPESAAPGEKRVITQPVKIPAKRPGQWFTRAEVAALKDVHDERQISQVISRRVPNATREETLFRYYLSRAVYLGEFELPLLPRSATQVLGLSRDPDSEISDYVRVIESDPALVHGIISTANSSFFASLSGTASLDQAIVRIGLRQVEQITMVHALRSKVFRVAGYDAMIQGLIEHGFHAALGAQIAAPKVLALPADAFLGGLFHDVGKLVLLKIVGEVQKKLSWQAPAELVSSCFEAYHTTFGEVVCRHWEFPEQICEAVRNHHEGVKAAGQPLDRAIYLGNVLAHSYAGDTNDENGLDAADPVLESAGIEPRELHAVLEDLAQELQVYQAIGLG